MAANEYHMMSHWRVVGTLEELRASAEVFACSMAEWWPAANLRVDVMRRGDAHGVGARARMHTRGWLPYTLRWELEITEAWPPHGFRFDTRGDFEGRGIWRLAQEGPHVHVTFDWKVRLHKPLVRVLSPVLRPLFVSNHRWAMARGEESFARELERRRTAGGWGAGRQSTSDFEVIGLTRQRYDVPRLRLEARGHLRSMRGVDRTAA